MIRLRIIGTLDALLHRLGISFAPLCRRLDDIYDVVDAPPPLGLFLEAPVLASEYGAFDDSEFEDDGCPNCGYVE